MADTGIFATTAEVQKHVPAQASTTANAESYINQYISEAESEINDESGYNWSDVYSTLNVDVKKILTRAAVALVVCDIIDFDKSGFFSESEALNSIEYQLTRYNRAISNLKKEGMKVNWVSGAGTN